MLEALQRAQGSLSHYIYLHNFSLDTHFCEIFQIMPHCFQVQLSEIYLWSDTFVFFTPVNILVACSIIDSCFFILLFCHVFWISSSIFSKSLEFLAILKEYLRSITSISHLILILVTKENTTSPMNTKFLSPIFNINING